jgi:hypothetical protein
MANDMSARPHEILNLKIKDILFKVTEEGNQYAEVLITGGKTRPRTLPLIDSASYVFYRCEYCSTKFQLVEPDNNFQAGGAIRFKRYRNSNTGEVKAYENRACGVCLECAKQMIWEQQYKT